MITVYFIDYIDQETIELDISHLDSLWFDVLLLEVTV